MNIQKIYYERRKILNQLRYSSLSGSKENCFKVYANETEYHMKKKFKAWLKLRKSGYSVWSEAIFNNKARPDLLAFKQGKWMIIEILETETLEELREKIKKYPLDIEIIKIKTYKDIENLEC